MVLAARRKTELKHYIVIHAGAMPDYPGVFQRVFGFIDPGHIPGFVYAVHKVETDELVGFIGAYKKSAQSVHLQYGGTTEDNRGFKAWVLVKHTIEEIEKEFKYITLSVENTNAPAIKVLTDVGFIVNGFHVSTINRAYLEMIKERNNG